MSIERCFRADGASGCVTATIKLRKALEYKVKL